MNALTIVVFACVAALATAAPSGVGVVLSGPSGVVTDLGPIGPVGHGWDDGSWDDGSYNGGWDSVGRSVAVLRHSVGPAALVGPSVGHAALVGPSVGPAALVGPSVGHASVVGPSVGHASVVGPSVAPASIVGPSVGHASVVGPSVGGVYGGLGGRGVVLGHGGGWAGAGALGGWAGGHGGWAGSAVQGVVVKGPPTVPATIVGPSGKVVADGLWGPTAVHGGHYGGHW